MSVASLPFKSIVVKSFSVGLIASVKFTTLQSAGAPCGGAVFILDLQLYGHVMTTCSHFSKLSSLHSDSLVLNYR